MTDQPVPSDTAHLNMPASNAQQQPSSGLDAFDYQAPTPEQTERIKAIRQHMKDLRDHIQNLIPASRERSLAITKLEECAMWANKGIVFNGPRPESQPPA